MAKIIPLKPKNIYQLKITLNNSKPPIWRRLLVNSDVFLFDLHLIIQVVMGWDNSHLHRFEINKKDYLPETDIELDGDTSYENLKLDGLVNQEKQTFLYEYDFGDGWLHRIELEKILPREKGEFYPKCTAGKRACPPEDCGGPWRYEDILKTLQRPKSEAYEELIDWLGYDFDPNEFDLEEINEFLTDIDFGNITLF